MITSTGRLSSISVSQLARNSTVPADSEVERLGAEDGEIVDCLGFEALRRAIALRQQHRAPTNRKFQPTPSSTSVPQ